MRRRKIIKSIKSSPQKGLKKLQLKHKVIFTLIGSVGVILVWRGIWTFSDINPFLNNPVSSIVVGLILVIISGFLFKLA
ncbi:hypothetical protein A2716_04205 [candidate division WWE3 bacterium RIFCSPHIGHO2_01_FULL_40_23]|uniref:Uncharacterized protein n=1 Tax=candidate division WWE3 bacterium RIFCSPLOWO2_01_FULL_41_18 TaxID=1802625 RepID=A0A1F4VD50_UNCKA|nr:MAG: hypothetical protein A2716_04205 [candidate division WWE3 bacterium RIFCSPHIGHO2_01_FULL_40_23]OGC55077.1 MAG: hypothetical protein A3A78_03815 [candidate division WWE3 bacterium RIFCSPLOWO2_01_FULL_41_18]